MNLTIYDPLMIKSISSPPSSMMVLSDQQLLAVSGGYGLTDTYNSALTGFKTGTVLGTIGSYAVLGTIAGATRGGLAGGALGLAAGFGYGVGTYIYSNYLSRGGGRHRQRWSNSV